MFLRSLVALFVLSWLPLSVQAAGKNVLVIVADDLGFQLGCYGDVLMKTPHMDGLAASGTRFTRAYCTTSSCSASRSVILTGLYNHSTAHYGHEHGNNHFRTYDNVRTLPVLLGEAGYRTCSIGKYHVAPEPTYHFERYGSEGVDAHNPVALAAAARKFLEDRDERPFFLYFCGVDPHRAAGASGFANEKPHPGVTPVVYDPDNVGLPAWLPDQPEVRREWAEYRQAISRFDQGVGALLKALADTGHADDTLVILLSDNGPPFPGAKTTLYQPGANLPLIVRRPGQQAGVVTDARVTWADLTPTILDFAGVKSQVAVTPGTPKRKPGEKPPALPGRSLLPILEQEHPEGWDEIYLSHTFHEITNYYPMRAVVSGRYKYIFNVAHQLPYPFASDLYASPTWQGVLKRGDSVYGQRAVATYLERDRHELYDLEADPGELKNLARDPAYREKLTELQGKVRDFQQRTGDPWASKWEYE